MSGALYLTVEEISASTGFPPGTVYRLAHEYRWRRTDTRPRGYRMADVLSTLRHRDLDISTSAKDHA